VSLIANTLGSIALFFVFRAYGLMPHLGIAVATTLGGWLNAGLLYATLVRRGYFVADQRLRRTLPRILISTLAMGAVLWIMAEMLAGSFGSSASPLVRFGALVALVGSGLAVYTGAVFATGALDMRQLRSFLKRRTPPAPI
jgi:putative peptidoglycan lipid II flippase